MRPKPYSSTDSAEQEAISTLLGLIDGKYVKPDIKVRDKIPNIDGTIEIVDDDQVPLGKLDIQVRSIPKDQSRYSCPASLVAYSTRSTLAVLLICVDAANKRAFWRHISHDMPEYKPDQGSFTINFSLASDSIASTNNYIQRWTNIVIDYQDRIMKFPILSKEIANRLNLQAVAPEDRELFQRFIDSVNNLLDNDFTGIKDILYPSGWKLGVGIVSSDQQRVHYQIYTIPYGEPAPLVCKLDGGSFTLKNLAPNTICEVISSRDTIFDSVAAGRNFVLSEARKIIENRSLPIYGERLAEDVLFSFVDSYYDCLGLSAGLDLYSVEELDRGLNQHLMGLCSQFIGLTKSSPDARIFIDLDSLCNFAKMFHTKTPQSTLSPRNFIIRSRDLPLEVVFSALNYLKANQIRISHRHFGRSDVPLSSGSHWIWSGYSSANEISSIREILDHSIAEYKVFTEKNHFKLQNSPYLDINTSVIFEYEPAGSNSIGGPNLREYHVDNMHHSLPKQEVFIRNPAKAQVDDSKFPVISVKGKTYHAFSSSYGIASFLFHRSPMLNMVYRMLCDDLSKQYKISLSPGLF